MSKLTFDRFQEVQALWAEENFGEQPGYRALLGAGEELGELFRAHLKGEQNIRGGTDKWDKEARKEVGDIITFLAQYATTRGWSLGECVEESWKITSDRNWQDFPDNGGQPDEPQKTGSEAAVPLPQPTKKSQVRKDRAEKKSSKPAPRGIALAFPDVWQGKSLRPQQLTQGALDSLNTAVSNVRREATGADVPVASDTPTTLKKLSPLAVAMAALKLAQEGQIFVKDAETAADSSAEDSADLPPES